MSRPVVEATLAEAAKACHTSVSMIEDVYACSPSQKLMIHDPSPDIYQIVLSSSTEVVIQRFVEALQRLALSRPILRTRIVRCGRATLQVVLKENLVPEQVSDLDDFLHATQQSDTWLGVPLFRLASTDRSLAATFHHAVMDYWSFITMFNVDMVAAYRGEPLQMRPAFKSFVTHCERIDKREAISFWAARFSDATFPSIFPEPKKAKPERMKKGKEREIASPHIQRVYSQMPCYIEAAWAIVAGLYTGNNCVAYGYMLSGRSTSSEEFRTTMGPTISEIPVQVNLQRITTVDQLIKDRAQSLKQLRQARALVHWGTENMIEAVPTARLAAGYQTLLNILPELAGPAHSADLKLDRMISIEGVFPLHLMFRITKSGFFIDSAFSPEAVPEDQLNRVLDQFEHVVHRLLQSPPNTKLSTLDILSAKDRQKMMAWNQAADEGSAVCIHELFCSRARARPHALAVEAHDGSATYRDLDQLSDRLAHKLREKGVSRQTAVAIVLERSLSAIIAIIGTLKAGGICVPIDEGLSHDRFAGILARIGIEVVLVTSAYRERFVNLIPDILTASVDMVASMADSLPPQTTTSTDAAFILGSDGRSDGGDETTLQHGYLQSTLTSAARIMDWQRPGVRMLHRASYASSLGLFEALGILISGGCLCIPPEGTNWKDCGANWAIFTPSELRIMSPRDAPSLTAALCTGRLFDAGTAARWSASVHLFRGWGPSCGYLLLSTITKIAPLNPPDDENVGFPIRSPVWTVSLQSFHNLAPVGSLGELVVERPGQCPSALQVPQWATSFGKGTSSFHRTGFLGRHNTDGSISIVGERNARVEIKGRIVQLEAIERALVGCDKLHDVVVSTRITQGRTQLVAVVCVAGCDPLPSGAAWQPHDDQQEFANILGAAATHARQALPVDLVPSGWIVMKRLPAAVDRRSISRWLRGRMNVWQTHAH